MSEYGIGKFYKIYILYKGADPIYVGISANVRKRVNQHKYTKDFDSVVIACGHGNYEKAKVIEDGIITLMKVINPGLINKHIPLNYGCRYNSIKELNENE